LSCFVFVFVFVWVAIRFGGQFSLSCAGVTGNLIPGASWLLRLTLTKRVTASVERIER
jgi:hypothetical protein